MKKTPHDGDGVNYCSYFAYKASWHLTNVIVTVVIIITITIIFTTTIIIIT